MDISCMSYFLFLSTVLHVRESPVGDYGIFLKGIPRASSQLYPCEMCKHKVFMKKGKSL